MMNNIAGHSYAHILLFITSVQHEYDRLRIAPRLDQLLGKNRWYIDVGDTDKVLRVEATADLSPEITAVLTQYGFECKQMQ